MPGLSAAPANLCAAAGVRSRSGQSRPASLVSVPRGASSLMIPGAPWRACRSSGARPRAVARRPSADQALSGPGAPAVIAGQRQADTPAKRATPSADGAPQAERRSGRTAMAATDAGSLAASHDTLADRSCRPPGRCAVFRQGAAAPCWRRAVPRKQAFVLPSDAAPAAEEPPTPRRGGAGPALAPHRQGPAGDPDRRPAGRRLDVRTADLGRTRLLGVLADAGC